MTGSFVALLADIAGPPPQPNPVAQIGMVVIVAVLIGALIRWMRRRRGA